MKNNLAVALEELARINEEVLSVLSSVLTSSNKILRVIASQIPADPQSVEYMNVEECAAFLKLTIPHLYRLTSEHKIPYSKPGRTLRFNKQEIIDWIGKHRVATDAELLGG